MALLVVLGLVAGGLSTVAGLGGGMLLVAALSLTRGPHEALALTSPALFVSNLHRAFMYRARVDKRVALAFAVGAVPGALLGGSIVPELPVLVLDVLLVACTLLALARARGWFRWTPRAGTLAPAGFGIGALAATSGGGGMLVSPLLLSAGLSGEAYVATVSASSIALHAGRIAGYFAGGLMHREMWVDVAVLALALLAGNGLGVLVRRAVRAGTQTKIELGALVVCTLVSVLGVLRTH